MDGNEIVPEVYTAQAINSKRTHRNSMNIFTTIDHMQGYDDP